MKKILILNTTFEQGGAAKIAKQLFEYLLNQPNVQISFAYGRGKKVANQKNVFKIGNILETLLQVLIVRLSGIEGIGCYFATRKLKNLIKKERFDLIHIHNLHGYYLNVFSFLKFLSQQKIRIIWTLHDEWAISSLKAFTMNCHHCSTGQGICENPYQYPKTFNQKYLSSQLLKKQKILDQIFRIISPNQPVAVCPTIWLKNNVLFQFNKIDIEILPNGVDQEIFQPRPKEELRKKYDLEPSQKIILFSAADLANPTKGFSHILKLAELLKEKNYLFLGLGKNIPENLPNLKSFGFIANTTNLAEIYALADLYCFTSQAENMPLVILEALASGLPVIAFNLKPLKEVIENDYGYLAEPGDLVNFSQKIVEIMENKALRTKMSQAARTKIEEKFTLKMMLENYLKLYLSHFYLDQF